MTAEHAVEKRTATDYIKPVDYNCAHVLGNAGSCVSRGEKSEKKQGVEKRVATDYIKPVYHFRSQSLGKASSRLQNRDEQVDSRAMETN